MPCFKVGVTGGIGSGKSTVSNIFQTFGVLVIDADEIAHAITNNHHPCLSLIVEKFGAEFIANGSLQRDKMRALVFSYPEKKKLLEDILHPIIRNEMDHLATQCNDSYCILSIPLLIESLNPYDRVDRILVVDTDENRRRGWIKQRNGLSDVEIDRIFAAQVSREERLRYADDVIENNQSIQSLEARVAELHKKYLQLSTHTDS